MKTDARRKPKFKVGQVVYAKDWKGARRLGKIVKVYVYDDGEIQYTAEWTQVERIYGEAKFFRALTKRERGGQP